MAGVPTLRPGLEFLVRSSRPGVPGPEFPAPGSWPPVPGPGFLAPGSWPATWFPRGPVAGPPWTAPAGPRSLSSLEGAGRGAWRGR